MSLARSLQKRWRKARLAFQPRALVLLYHRVADAETDPQLLCVSPGRFDEQLAALRRHCPVLSLAALREAQERGTLPPRSVAVTFDDGYADNLLAAKPILARHEVPATVYVTTSAVGTAAEFWWDELERILLAPPALPSSLALVVGGQERRWELPASDAPVARGWSVLDPGAPTPRQRLYADVAKLLHPLDAPARAAALASLRAWAGLPAAGRPTHRAMTAAEVAALADGGLVEVGSHTVTHTLLSALDPAAQRREIAESKATLEGWIGRPVASFSYPFGYRRSYGPDTVAMVREAGFRDGCSNFPGVVTASTPRFELPRFLVRNWDGEELLRRLRTWAWVPG